MSTKTRILAVLGLVSAALVALWLYMRTNEREPDKEFVQRIEALDDRSHAAPETLETGAQLSQQEESAARELVPGARGAQEVHKANAPPLKDDLVVQVIDPAENTLADVPLRVLPVVTPPGFGNSSRPELSKTTNSKGRAVFIDLRSMLSPSSDAWTLVADVALETPPVKKLDAAELAQPVVTLSMPFTGSIETHVHEIDGAEAPDGSAVQLVLLREQDLSNPILPRDRLSWNATTNGGRAFFPVVELGRTWEVLASRPGSEVRSRARARGPSKAHAIERLDVVLGSDHPVIVYRAVDQQKNPLPHVTLEVEHNVPFGDTQRTQERTDAAGRFRVEAEGVRGFFGVKSFLVTWRPEAHSLFLGRATVPAGLTPGLNDGGDVVLAPEPLLAAGRVVDEAGRPIAEADVLVSTATGMNRQFGWPDRAVARRGQSDESGHFEIHALLTDPVFELRAEGNGLRSLGVRVQEGDSNVLLVLTRFGVVSGRLLVDAGVDPRGIQFGFEDQQKKPVGAKVSSISIDGSFVLEPIPSGTYDLTLSLEGQRLAVLEKIAVTQNTNVGTIDLREKLKRCEIILLGAPDPTKIVGEMAWRESGTTERWINRNFQGSSIEFSTPFAFVDVWVRPYGYRSDIQRNVAGRREVHLTTPLRVRLELRTTGQLPKPPYFLYPDLDQDGVRVAERESPLAFTDENRSLVYQVSAPGRVHVGWKFEWHREDASTSGGVLRDRGKEIEVLDIDGEQVFEIDLDADALNQLVNKPPW